MICLIAYITNMRCFLIYPRDKFLIHVSSISSKIKSRISITNKIITEGCYVFMWRSNRHTPSPLPLSYNLIRWSFDPVNTTDLQQTWTGDDGWAGQRHSRSQTHMFTYTHGHLFPSPLLPDSPDVLKSSLLSDGMWSCLLSLTHRPPSPRPARWTCAHTPARLIPNCLNLVILTTLVSAVTLTQRYWSIQVKNVYVTASKPTLLFFLSRWRPFQKRAFFAGHSA